VLPTTVALALCTRAPEALGFPAVCEALYPEVLGAAGKLTLKRAARLPASTTVVVVELPLARRLPPQETQGLPEDEPGVAPVGPTRTRDVELGAQTMHLATAEGATLIWRFVRAL